MNKLIKQIFSTHLWLAKCALERDDRKEASYHCKRARSVLKANLPLLDSSGQLTATFTDKRKDIQ
tara:strand:+ start:580 stop:774 length:195 start_codon:yes stop_codon:yes gene_type:complete